MKGFEVFVNQHRVCMAAIGENGVLTVHVTWIGSPGEDGDLSIHVGGLNSFTDQHVSWEVPPINVGTTVLVRIVDVESNEQIDPPQERRRSDEPNLEQFGKRLREYSEQLKESERVQLLKNLVADLAKTTPLDVPN